MTNHIRRRQFITLLGSAAAGWSFVANAQQAGVPVVGFLYQVSPDSSQVAAFAKGMGEMGYADGRNVSIEYRFAHNELNRLPQLAADLVSRRVTVIVADQTAAALAAKAATATIPIVFRSGTDVVDAGLVATLNRPGGNLTGMNVMNVELGPKRLGLLHELLPRATRFGHLVNSNSPGVDENMKGARAAVAKIGSTIEVFSATTDAEIDMVFAGPAFKRVEALVVAPQTLFNTRRVQLATLAARYAMPTIFPSRTYAEVGGLMSYGGRTTDQFHQVGFYVGRILKGEKPADLPVMQPTKFELVINLQTAKLLGLTVPPTLLAIADEVIE